MMLWEARKTGHGKKKELEPWRKPSGGGGGCNDLLACGETVMGEALPRYRGHRQGKRWPHDAAGPSHRSAIKKWLA